MLKVLHITSLDTGGAGIAAMRLHNALLKLNVDSKVLVLDKKTDKPDVYEIKKTNRFLNLFLRVSAKLGFPLTTDHANYKRVKKLKGDFEFFSFATSSHKNLVNHPLVQSCDIINLHWVAYLLDFETFFKSVNKPVVWTQHDMNAFQGGFHYREDDLNNRKVLFNINNEQYQIKKQALTKLSKNALTIVSPSAWMMQEASQSEMLRRFNHFHVPNGVPPETFKYQYAAHLKKKLNFNTEKLTVLFVAEHVSSKRKGFQYIEALVKNETLQRRCEFVAVGSNKNTNALAGVKYLGSIQSEELLSEIYSAADIYLLSSREDNLPNVMLESLAAGTPVVAFNVGGIKDVVADGINGFLSDEISVKGLTTALLKCIDYLPSFDRKSISQALINKYNNQAQAIAYLNIYNNQIEKYNSSYTQKLIKEPTE